MVLKKQIAWKGVTRNEVEYHSLRLSTLFRKIQNTVTTISLSLFKIFGIAVPTMLRGDGRGNVANAQSKRPFPSCILLCVKTSLNAKIFIWKCVSPTGFFNANQTHFHIKGLVLKQRHKVSRKWPIPDKNIFQMFKVTLQLGEAPKLKVSTREKNVNETTMNWT